MDLEAGNIYYNNEEYRKILNINNNMIEYEKLQVIKYEDVDSFSNWAESKSEQNAIIKVRHFSSRGADNLNKWINDWIEDISCKYSIIDIDTKYNSILDSPGVIFSALITLKLREL